MSTVVPPQGPVADATAATVLAPAWPLEGHRAGFASRAIAFTVDFLIVIAGYPAMLWGIGLTRGLLQFEAPSYPDLPTAVSALLSATWTIGYFALAWTVVGRTVGQAVLGLRVVRRSQPALGIMRALARAWLMMLTVFLVGPLWLFFSRSRLALHDRLTGTQVVYARPGHRPLVAMGLGAKGAGRSGP
jgi:uncharacterized RDD family membrane protein YckC